MSTSNDISAQDLWKRRKIVKVDGLWTVEGRPRTVAKILQVEQPANIPGKSYVAVLVTLAPNSATPPHTHNGAAIYAQVIKGKVCSQMIHTHTKTAADGKDESVEHDSGVGTYGPGEMWYEAPGCYHVRAENNTDEEAQFYANFIIDTAKLEAVDNIGKALTILDVDVQEGAKI